MACVRMDRIPDTDPPSHPNRRLRRWLIQELHALHPLVAQSAASCQADRYRKRFDSFAHVCLLLCYGFTPTASLRQCYAALPLYPGLLALSGLADPRREVGIGFSTWADANTTRPSALLAGIAQALIARVKARGQTSALALPSSLYLLDSTILQLSVKLAGWLPRPDGIRVQVGYLPALDLPDAVLVTTTTTSDCRGLDRLLLEPRAHGEDAPATAHAGLTLVHDLGYYSHRRLARVLAAGMHVVTRLQPQAVVVVEEELPVQASLNTGKTITIPAGRITVQRDQRITLGSPNNRAGAVLPAMRLVTARVEPLPRATRQGATTLTYRLVTDRWDLDAAEVVACYLARWDIELFFRWIKRSIRLIRLLGFSSTAVETSVWLAILVHVLTVLAAAVLGEAGRSPSLLLRLCLLIASLSPQDLQREPSPVQLPLFPPLGPPPPT